MSIASKSNTYVCLRVYMYAGRDYTHVNPFAYVKAYLALHLCDSNGGFKYPMIKNISCEHKKRGKKRAKIATQKTNEQRHNIHSVYMVGKSYMTMACIPILYLRFWSSSILLKQLEIVSSFFISKLSDERVGGDNEEVDGDDSEWDRTKCAGLDDGSTINV